MATADGTSAPAKRPPRKTAQGGTRRGDATGRLREVQAREHAAEQQEATSRMALMTAQRQRSLSDDVIDLSNPRRPVFDGTDIPVDEEIRESEAREGRETLISAPNRNGFEVTHIEETTAPRTATEDMRLMTPKRKAEYLAEIVPFQVNEDLEEFTFGRDNTVTLTAYQRYKGPRAMVMHLEEKGLLA